ncbi:hypothetical protein ACKWTF_014684 [Chironomus riparius]
MAARFIRQLPSHHQQQLNHNVLNVKILWINGAKLTSVETCDPGDKDVCYVEYVCAMLLQQQIQVILNIALEDQLNHLIMTTYQLCIAMQKLHVLEGIICRKQIEFSILFMTYSQINSRKFSLV